MQQSKMPDAMEGPVAFNASLRSLWRVMAAEALKQHRLFFGSRLTYFSLFIWPVLQLTTAYYTFKPFLDARGFAEHWSLAANPQGVFLFLATGMLGYTFFWSLVQSAWQFSRERFYGTLELIFLTPVNRLALLVANGTMALFQSTWLFLVFSIGLVTLIGGHGLHISHPAMFLVAFLALLIPAVAWGTFLNSIFIFWRDASFLMTFLDEPTFFFAGVRIPLLALPIWARAVGALFPLTFSLGVLRDVLLEGATLITLWPQLLLLVTFSLVLLLAATWLLKRGEQHARITGSLTLF